VQFETELDHLHVFSLTTTAITSTPSHFSITLQLHLSTKSQLHL